ncbi:MAG: CPBP family intramembrane metalloprotease [Chloroflexi bacterium]|nr:CPBP family intramembrane metalloprotease [Chloroflexota bacterium]
MTQQRSRVALSIAVLCLSWFILATLSSMPAYYISLALDQPIPGDLYTVINHGLRLAGGLVLIFVLLPRLPAIGRENLPSRVGITWPRTWAERTVVVAFTAAVGGALVVELLNGGLAGVREFHTQALWLVLFTSLQAALIEELLLRGLAFDTIRSRWGLLAAFGLTSLVFGFFHVYWGLARVGTTAFMGGVFALVRWRSGSVWPAVIVHFLINVGFPIPAWLGVLVALMVSAGFALSQSAQPAPEFSA